MGKGTTECKDEYVFVELLKMCAKQKDVQKGIRIHADAIENGLLQRRPYVASSLINMYAKCGDLTKAQQVLEDLSARDVFSWSALIAGYAQQGQGQKGLDCFAQMQRESLMPNEITFSCLLKACSCVRAIQKGKQIHNDIFTSGLLVSNTILGNALVDMYAKCGVLDRAKQVFEELPARNIVSWSTLIAGYVQQGQGYMALQIFSQMLKEGLSPNEVTFSCILKACGSTGAISKGIEIHEELSNNGLLERNIMLGNALLDMYSKCGVLSQAQLVLEELSVRDIISWNAIIAGYAQQDEGNEALNCFTRMQNEGLAPDEVTFICTLRACGHVRTIDMGKQIHSLLVHWDLFKKNILLGTSLVDMYAKCGEHAKARQVLEELTVRDTVSWNALISGYVLHGNSHEALNCFTSMQRDGLFPNEVTFLSILKACGSIGAIDKGREIHDQIVGGDFLQKEIVLGTALVDMYAKCGAASKARKVLEELPIRETASWNALIAGYAQEGRCLEVLNCFEQMQREGVSPDDVTMLCLLNACSHSGMHKEAQIYYESMSLKYGVIPKLRHQTCMVMVFGYTGRFEKAISVIKTMPSYNPSIWLAVLCACRKLGNVKLGRLAFDQATLLDTSLATPYIIMADMYTVAGMEEDAKKIAFMMRQRNISVDSIGIYPLRMAHSEVMASCTSMDCLDLIVSPDQKKQKLAFRGVEPLETKVLSHSHL